MGSKFADDNRKFFDDLAAKYDVKEWQRNIIAKVGAFLQENVEFIGLKSHAPAGQDNVSLLDYACGTGAVSQALAPFVSSIQGIDLSSKMLERYHEAADKSTIPAFKNAVVRQGDLVATAEPPPELSGPELHEFSVAVISAGFHHFENQELTLQRLAQRLRSGGNLVIVDFLEDEEPWKSTSADHVIHKHGYSKHEMRELMEKANLTNFGWKEMDGSVNIEFESKTMNRRLFLAKAAKA